MLDSRHTKCNTKCLQSQPCPGNSMCTRRRVLNAAMMSAALLVSATNLSAQTFIHADGYVIRNIVGHYECFVHAANLTQASCSSPGVGEAVIDRGILHSQSSISLPPTGVTGFLSGGSMHIWSEMRTKVWWTGSVRPTSALIDMRGLGQLDSECHLDVYQPCITDSSTVFSSTYRWGTEAAASNWTSNWDYEYVAKDGTLPVDFNAEVGVSWGAEFLLV
jgi:hypothetical protein